MDSNSYFTVIKAGEGLTEVKKSKFIAKLIKAASEEEAAAALKDTKKKYYDASHSCSAYILKGDGGLRHSSDDGEPSGTAGKPILDVLSGANLMDAMIIVTRYFGGTLLGTGGLVRAYTEAAKAALFNAKIKEVKTGSIVTFIIDYTLLARIQRLCDNAGILIGDIVYGEKVEIPVILTVEKESVFYKNLTEMTGGSLTEESAVRKEVKDYYEENNRAIFL